MRRRARYKAKFSFDSNLSHKPVFFPKISYACVLIPDPKSFLFGQRLRPYSKRFPFLFFLQSFSLLPPPCVSQRTFTSCDFFDFPLLLDLHAFFQGLYTPPQFRLSFPISVTTFFNIPIFLAALLPQSDPHNTHLGGSRVCTLFPLCVRLCPSPGSFLSGTVFTQLFLAVSDPFPPFYTFLRRNSLSTFLFTF